MPINQAREFYIKIKEYFDEEKFQNFYNYFERTLLNIDQNKTVKFDFNLWCYYDKFDFKKKEINF